MVYTTIDSTASLQSWQLHDRIKMQPVDDDDDELANSNGGILQHPPPKPPLQYGRGTISTVVLHRLDALHILTTR
jgi:hypothetical protein